MKRRYLLLGFCVLLLGTLLACCFFVNQQPSAPMAQRQDQVKTSLKMLPESLFEAELVASGSHPLVCLDSILYEVQFNAYRRMEIPMEQISSPKLVTPAPDSGFWMVLETKQEGSYLVKTSSQGTVLVQQKLKQSDVNSIICDSIGRVYIVVNDCTEVQRYSPEGELQGTVKLDTLCEAAYLVVRNDRVFAACFESGWRRLRRANYMEIFEDFSVGERFCGCVKMESSNGVNAIGSFLPEYILMEYDDAGLYACRENGDWETVCRWSDQHLDGTVSGRLVCDVHGYGVVLYEKNGSIYTLTLSSVKKS